MNKTLVLTLICVLSLLLLTAGGCLVWLIYAIWTLNIYLLVEKIGITMLCIVAILLIFVILPIMVVDLIKNGGWE